MCFRVKTWPDGSRIDVFPSENLVAQTNYTMNIKITYQKLQWGNWINVTQNGVEATELTAVNFKTGDNPPFIDQGNIGFMYPYYNQKFYYKGDATQGRVLLKNTQNELFASFNRWKARFTTTSNNQVVAVTDVTYDPVIKSVAWPMPSNLALNTGYKLELYGEGYISGSLISDTTRPILQCTFNTSRYNTLAEKFAALQLLQSVVGRVESDVIDLQANVSNYEGFDVAEMIGTQFTGNEPLISGEALLGDEKYYNEKIQPLIKYPNFYSYAGITISRPTDQLGVLPTKAISVSNYYLTAAQSPNYNTILFDRIPFIYDLNKVFNADFIELRNRIVNKYMSNMGTSAPTVPMYRLQCCFRIVLAPEWVAYFSSAAYRQAQASSDLSRIPAEMQELVTKPFPFMYGGDYKTNFRLRRAASWSSPYSFNYENSADGQFTYKNPILTVFVNNRKEVTLAKNDCNAGESGTTVNVVVEAGKYSSIISQADADAKADYEIQVQGQNMANTNGECCINGLCYRPGWVQVTVQGTYNGCGNGPWYYPLLFFQNGSPVQYEAFPEWNYQTRSFYLPAGVYQMGFYDGDADANSTYLTTNGQYWFGNYITTGDVLFNANSSHWILLNVQCGNGNQQQ
jgi:hypothetical protein